MYSFSPQALNKNPCINELTEKWSTELVVLRILLKSCSYLEVVWPDSSPGGLLALGNVGFAVKSLPSFPLKSFFIYLEDKTTSHCQTTQKGKRSLHHAVLVVSNFKENVVCEAPVKDEWRKTWNREFYIAWHLAWHEGSQDFPVMSQGVTRCTRDLSGVIEQTPDCC